MNKTFVYSAIACAVAAGVFADAKTAVDLPVSEVGNIACIESMSSRPWWNKEWTRRAPILISNASDAENRNVMVDCIVDFGEEINPDEVRVVTPWEELVDCVAERVQSSEFKVQSSEFKVQSEAAEPLTSNLEPRTSNTALRLLFKTSLRVRENKPFLVYWGNPKAKKPDPMSSTTMRVTDDEIRIMNGKVDVTFDKLQRTDGIIKKLRILGSQAQTELLMRASGYAWTGFELALHGERKWTSATVVADNAFKKSVRFDYNQKGSVTLTVYDEQPRVDWRYELVGCGSTRFVISWACGGDVGFDRIVYPGLAGKDLSVMATLDSASDCIAQPDYDFTPYINDGWYAIHDRRVNDVVGLVFDRAALSRLTTWGNGQAGGLQMTHSFEHKWPKKDETGGVGEGAIVATMGKWQDVRDEAARLKAKPLVFSGKAEGVRDIAVTHPRLDHDWVFSYDSNGWKTSASLEGSEWATNVAVHLRSLGGNVSRGGPRWEGISVPEDLYTKVTNTIVKLKPDREKQIAKWGQNGNFTGKKFTEQCDAMHAKGLSVSIWGGFCPVTHDLDRTIPELVKYDIELQNLYPKCGMDCVYNAAAQGEGPAIALSTELKKANNNEDWRRWKNVDDFFKAQDDNTERVKKFYKEAKKRNPNVPVVMWNSENSEVGREMFMSDQAGYFDTCMVEILPHYDIVHVKNVVKRMRALFDNDAARTVHHHYYYYGADRQDYANRISEIELPFVCGCNGFSYENLTYEHYDREAVELVADFARLAEYTGLGEKAAKMEPVKNVAVFRDSKMFPRDIKDGNHGQKHGWRTRTDNRIHGFGFIRNYNFDIVVNRYFTKDALKKYKVVYIPEDPEFTKDLAKELRAYVEAGGGAILEGATALVEKFELEDGIIKEFGKGKIVWLKEPLTDRIVRNEYRALERAKELIAAVGGENPYTLESTSLDSVLQASNDGMLLSVFNKSDNADTGKIVIEPSTSRLPPSAFILDVKSGKRYAFTNGFEIAVAPRQCGYYLIGDDKFTALPEVHPAAWCGASRVATLPNAKLPVANVPTNFTQAVGVEFTNGTADKPNTTRRSFESAIIVRPMTKDVYSPRKMRDALEGATYLHFVGTATSSADPVFADCANELKALLKRGGGIIFDRMITGPNAREFLKSIDVFDPNEFAVGGGDDATLCSNLSTNSLLYPNQAGWFNQGLHYSRSFPRWDTEKQFATHVGKHNPTNAMAVAQENVLGAGRIIFAQNDRAFNDWYENMRYGDSILSWVIGRQVTEHAKLVKDQNGGPGDVEK